MFLYRVYKLLDVKQELVYVRVPDTNFFPFKLIVLYFVILFYFDFGKAGDYPF